MELFRGGAEMYCFQIDDCTIPHEMYITRRTWSENEMLLFFKFVKKYYKYKPLPGDIFLDIGANIGTTSIWISKNIKNPMRVYAFEPNPDTYRILSANIILNGCENVNAINMALGNREENLKMYTFKGNSGRNQIMTEANRGKYIRDEAGLISVKGTTLEKWIKEEKIETDRIKYIWIDAEGFEPFILDGMKSVLSRRKIPIFVEFSKDIMTQEMFEIFYQAVKSYDGFVCANTINGDVEEKKIGNLPEFYRRADVQYNLFLF